MNTRILIVDDEPDIVQSYVDFLNFRHSPPKRSSRTFVVPVSAPAIESYELLTASSAEGAVALVKSELAAGRRFVGGFFDVKMPGKWDGLQGIQEIWKLDRDLHCTVATAYHDRSIDDIDALFGNDFKDQWDYLNKPFTLAEITQKARQMIASWNRKRALEAARADLVRSERLAAVGQVARAIGHEFGNILQTIVGKADLAIHDTDGAKNQERLRLILQAAEKASLIVRNLQSFSRSSSDRGWVECPRMIQDTLSLMNHELKKNSISVTLALETQERVKVSKNEIEQVLLNLIINAVHAMPGGGTLELGCRDLGDDSVLLWVKDSGTGIPTDVLSHIFEYAFTTKGESGSGIGLSISRDIVEKHGGVIRANSTGQGALFEIELPKGQA